MIPYVIPFIVPIAIGTFFALLTYLLIRLFPSEGSFIMFTFIGQMYTVFIAFILAPRYGYGSSGIFISWFSHVLAFATALGLTRIDEENTTRTG